MKNFTVPTWTIFGYYGGPLRHKGDECYCVHYTVDDFGTLVEADFNAGGKSFLIEIFKS